ncbi:hypothetical protein FGO68_gene10629 [Halteria grandinella]|uniref:Uncharacterized protein n=1 Tax=Halteria grandinella TaxID=5974 RepID=A0A8J8SY62_HALGN|nr:hypothetical protein FGO68_gene10629 [Halteria grandinella]
MCCAKYSQLLKARIKVSRTNCYPVALYQIEPVYICNSQNGQLRQWKGGALQFKQLKMGLEAWSNILTTDFRQKSEILLKASLLNQAEPQFLIQTEFPSYWKFNPHHPFAL